ncbi:MAG TPA: DUF4160 domain-containing protein [Candidatus Binatia bacterium]|nr:DUF4160 domain-containing protein [Candidatus Binatia bacterium]
MPRISQSYGITIWMDRLDHPPPHFHAQYGEFWAGLEIGSGRVLEGWLPPRAVRLVRTWARQHVAELDDNWQRAQALAELVAIEPLA